MEYYQSLRLDYKWRTKDMRKEQFITKLRIEPCKDFIRTGGRESSCCEGINEIFVSQRREGELVL